MEEEALIQRVLHLRQVEKLSQRQIAAELKIGRKRVRQILQGKDCAHAVVKKSILDEYRQLVAHWYQQYPRLKAIQIHERLRTYGYSGSYASVARLSLEYRKPRQAAYHPLEFLPGEEAQVDWFFLNHERLGFFLAGHLECFKHLGGLARCHRYDNLKSVVLTRTPAITYNPQFIDFARFYGFSIYLCNPYSGNEKGRVERLIRDIRSFLYGETFVDRADLNRKFHLWLDMRNTRIHRSTGKTPKDMLSQERLIHLPQELYPPRRIIAAVASKTALVEFETNTYSVPSSCAGKPVDIAAYPDHIEI
jgi:transcriptional regulator with XRE-family HTH domain